MHSLFSRSRTTSTPKKHQPPSIDHQPSLPTDDFGRLDVGGSEFLGLYVPKSSSSSKAPYGHLSHHTNVILPPEDIERLVDVLAAELSSRGGLTTPFVFSSQALDISRSGVARLITRFVESITGGKESEKRWREEARFAGMHELGMALRWGLGRAVRRVGKQRGLVQWTAYVQWRDAEVRLGYPPTHFAAFLEMLDPVVQATLLTTFALLTSLTANSASSGHTPPTLSPLFGPLVFGLPPASFHETYSTYLRATNGMEHLLIAFIRWRDVVGTQGGGAGSAATLGVPTRLKDWIRGYPANLPAAVKDRVATREARRGARTVRVTSVRRNVRMYTQDLVSSAATWGAKRPGSSPPTTGLISSKEWSRIVPPSMNLPPRYSDAYMKRMDMGPSTLPDYSYTPNPSSSSYSYSSSSSSPYTAPPSQLTNSNSTFTTSTTYAPLSSSSSHGAPKIMLNTPSVAYEDRFRSLTDLKWGAFESLGFGGIGGRVGEDVSAVSSMSENRRGSGVSSGGSPGNDGERKLMFDLTEGARQARAQKRSTLTWTDFSTAGFTRTDEPLTATLQFNPLTASSSASSINTDAITKKLRKTAKGLPEFGWDTEPVIGSEEVVEEAFVDVFCDLIWSSGWGETVVDFGLEDIRGTGEEAEMRREIVREMQRETELEKECNWAMVEFKSMPHRSGTSIPGADPRTGTSLLLFEEFVPLEYRQALAVNLSKGSKRRLPSLFSNNGSSSPLGQNSLASSSVASINKSPSMFTIASISASKNKSKNKKARQNDGWRQAETLNGRPYNIGDVPSMSSGTRSPSEKQYEFEGMLKSGNKDTKVLSLGTSGATHKAVLSPRMISAPVGIPAIASPIPVTPTTPRAPTVPPPVPPIATPNISDSTSSDGHNTSGTSSHSRFRLPITSPGVAKREGRVPAEYSSVDFETQLAVMSDEDDSDGVSNTDTDMVEEAEKRRQRQRRRESGEDAWVDILVGTQARRMGAQEHEAERKKAHARRSNPALASLAVAEALRGVQDRSPSPPSPGGLAYDNSEMDHSVEIATVPRTVDLYAEDDERERLKAAANDDDDEPLIRPRRLGYFDLHPERKPADASDDSASQTHSRTSHSFDDPRSRLVDAESDDESEESVFSPVDVTNGRAPVPPPKVTPPAPTPVIFPTQPKIVVPAPAPSTPSPSTPTSGPALSKTASLIEMYREREAKGSPTPVREPVIIPRATPVAPLVPKVPIPVLVAPTPLQPSRIPQPVRPLPVPSGTTVPAPAPAPAKISPTPSPVPAAAAGLAEPPRIDPTGGRDSPARYVHGAPLHNVMEEEEDE